MLFLNNYIEIVLLKFDEYNIKDITPDFIFKEAQHYKKEMRKKIKLASQSRSEWITKGLSWIIAAIILMLCISSIPPELVNLLSHLHRFRLVIFIFQYYSLLLYSTLNTFY